MISQTTVTAITMKGNFAPEAGFVAALNINNDPDYKELSEEDFALNSAELAAFLLNVVPASILSETLDIIEDDVFLLAELGDKFDEEAFAKIGDVVDPGLNAYLVQKIQLWKSGVYSTAAMLAFIQKAIEYVDAGHKELY